MKNLTESLDELNKAIIATIGYPKLIVLALVLMLIGYLLRSAYIRSQYSKEAWIVRKKNGPKSVFWYDKNGNKVYHRPRVSNPPNRRNIH